jgi:hypothetical protein
MQRDFMALANGPWVRHASLRQQRAMPVGRHAQQEDGR